MRKHIIRYVCLSFVVGITFGYLNQTGAFKKVKITQPQSVKVLTSAGLIPGDLFENYQIENNVEVTLVTYSTHEEFVERLKQVDQFDLVLAPHTLVPELISQNLISPIVVNNLKNIMNVAADFRDLPTDPGGLFSIPLVWGINAKHKLSFTESAPSYLRASAIPNNGLVSSLVAKARNFRFHNSDLKERQSSALWIQSFVIPRQAANEKSAYQLIDFFLNSDIAIELTRLTNKSSTNIMVEPTKLDPKLKPSHLRSQKLAQLTRVM